MISKVIKWGMSCVRIVVLKIRFGKRLKIEKSTKKPVYIGKNCRFCIAKDSQVIIGASVYMTGNIDVTALEGSDIIIGAGVFIGRDCILASRKGIVIGAHTLLAPGVSLYDHNHIYNQNKIISKQGFTSEKIVIGENSWLGKNSVITKGCNVNGQLVLGANAVLIKKNLEHLGGIYVGNPAVKIVR